MVFNTNQYTYYNSRESSIFNNTTPTIVVFISESEPRCQEFLNDIRKAFSDDVNIYTIDAFDNRRMAHEFKVEVIPSALIFKNGKVKYQFPYQKNADLLKWKYETILTERNDNNG